MRRFVLPWIAGCWLLHAGLSGPAGAQEPDLATRESGEAVAQAGAPSEAPIAQSNAAVTPLRPQANATSASSRSAFPRPGLPAPGFNRPLIEPDVTTQTRQALGFYGGYAARATLSQMPRRAPIHAGAPQPMYRQIKPFHTVYHEPTVSPYLNLYREENDSEGAPNYFAFVRPQMEQIEASRLQQREIQRLRGQVQGRPSAVPAYQAGGPRRTSVPARYMDTAQFYGGWQR